MKKYLEETAKILKLYTRGQGFEMKEEDRRGFRFIGILIVLLVMIPSCLGAGFITYVMTLAFKEAGGGSEGLLFIVQFLSAFALVFGFGVVMNTFYYSSDIDFLLALPLRPGSIILSQFLLTYVAESGMEFLVIISAWAGYLAAAGFSVSGVLLCLISTFTLPILPLVYCGIVSLIVMYLFKGIGSKRVLNIFMTLLSLLFLLGAVISFGGLKGLSVENFIETLKNHDNAFMNLMNVIFFPGYILINGLNAGGAGGLILYIVSSLAAVLVFLLLAAKIYLPGLYAFRSGGYGRKKTVRRGKIRERKPFIALFFKDLKILFRTKGFVTNCVLINLFWPVIIFIVLLMQSENNTIIRFIVTYHSGYVLARITLIVVFLGLGAMTAAANSIASTVVTREGKHAAYMKYIPVSYKTQLAVKGLLGVIISTISYLADVAIISRTFALGIKDSVYYTFIGLCMIVTVSLIGIVMDTANPKLAWENESNAMRANMNVFMNMAVAMLLIILMAVVGFVLYNIKSTTNVFIARFYLVMVLFGTAAVFLYSGRKAVKNMAELNL